MTEADLDQVMEIEHASFRAPWSRQVFAEELGREWAYVDVVRHREAGGRSRVVAFCNYWLVRDEVHVLNVATHPDHRRRGHGRRLMHHVVDFARRHRCRYITLEVRRSNDGALALYREFGFRSVGVRPNYYVEDSEDAIVMLLELDVPGDEPAGGG
ncbi:MAG: ribosomal-protein-alanine N-acetyltransferase [Deltaproteobacteria bacterium]|nr:MAG: ribosomal-protein-alanine N-acetyltransferase [Deltaproteobacteria bacterium]